MTLYEYYDRQIPDYYDGMYLDGYTPEQILHAARRKMLDNFYDRQNEVDEVKITSEVKIKK